MSNNKELPNGYTLSREWFDFCFVNPELVRPIHTAIYFFAIEHCNRLGWKEKFGFPSQMVMEAIGIKNWKTYSKALSEVVDFGFIEMLERSKNQYSSNIIAIVKNTEAPTKALDKALSKHMAKHSTKHVRSTVSIIKQLTSKPFKQRTKKERYILKEYVLEKPNTTTVREFYEDQLTLAIKHKAEYQAFINILFGKNDTKEPLYSVLGIEKQVTYENFEKLLIAKRENKTSITTVLLQMENDDKYTKGKKDLYRTLKNWLIKRFI